MAACGRHHALASPYDVETWYAMLSENRKDATVNAVYFVRIEGLCDWL